MKNLFDILNERLNQESTECSFLEVGSDTLYQNDIKVVVNDTYVTITTRGVFFEGKRSLPFLDLSTEQEESLFSKAYELAQKNHNKNMEQFKTRLL